MPRKSETAYPNDISSKATRNRLCPELNRYMLQTEVKKGVQFMGVHLMGVCFMGVYLTGVHLTSMYLTGVHLTSVHLMGVYLACTSQPCIS